MFYIVYEDLGYNVGKILVAASAAVRELTRHCWNHPTSGVRQLDKQMRQAGVLLVSLAAHRPNCQRRQWHPTAVLWPGKSHGWRSLVGCSPWRGKESDTTERLHFGLSLSCIGEGNGNPLQCSCLENPRCREPGGLPSMGSHRVRHDWSDLAAAAAAAA